MVELLTKRQRMAVKKAEEAKQQAASSKSSFENSTLKAVPMPLKGFSDSFQKFLNAKQSAAKLEKSITFSHQQTDQLARLDLFVPLFDAIISTMRLMRLNSIASEVLISQIKSNCRNIQLKKLNESQLEESINELIKLTPEMFSMTQISIAKTSKTVVNLKTVSTVDHNRVLDRLKLHVKVERDRLYEELAQQQTQTKKQIQSQVAL